MQNVYATIDNKYHTVLFSQNAVNTYMKLYPKANFKTYQNLQEAVNKARPRGSAAISVYAVKNGKVKGFFFTSKELVKMTGSITGWKGKKCKNIEEGYRYIYGTAVPKNLKNEECTFEKIAEKDIAYVDGSYMQNDNVMGIAYTIVHNKNSITHSSFIKTERPGSSTKAELISTMMAIEHAVHEGIRDLTIIHDNAQIAEITRSKKQKDDFNKKYLEFIQEMTKRVNIDFVKIKSHSGDEKNNFVDRLSRHKNIGKFIEMI